MADKNDILAMIAGGGSSYSSPVMDTKAEAARIVAEEPPSMMQGLLGAATEGGLFGFSDEAAGAMARMGKSPDASLAGDLTTEITRAYNKKFAEDHPYLSLGANVAGAIPSAIAAAPETLMGMAAMGGLQGALTGFGSGEGEDRGANALMGGALGLGAGAGIPLAIKGTVKGVQKLADFADTSGLVDYLSRALTSLEGQAGAVGKGVPQVASKTAPSPADLLAIKLMRDRSAEGIADAAQTLAEGQAQGTPLALADVGGQRVQQVADYLVNVAPEAAEIGPEAKAARAFLDERVAAQPYRMMSLASDLAPEGSSYANDLAARQIAKEAEAGFKQARKEVSQPLYNAIQEYAPTEELNAALAKPATTQAIDEILSNPILAEEFKGKSLTDPNLLIEARRRLGIKAGVAAEAGDNQIAEKYMQAKDLLNTAMEAQPEFTAANAAYKEASKPLNALFGNKVTGEPGTIARLLKTNGASSKEAGQIIMELRPEQILQTKEILGEKGTKLMRNGVKAYVMELAENSKDRTTQGARNLANTPILRESLEAALGKEEAAKLLKKVGYEKIIVESAGRFAPNSQTAGRLEAAKYFQGLAPQIQGFASRITSPSQWGSIVSELANIGGENEELKKSAARLLFDPYASAEFFKNNQDLLLRVIERNRLANQVIQSAAPVVSQPSAVIGSLETSKAAKRGKK